MELTGRKGANLNASDNEGASHERRDIMGILPAVMMPMFLAVGDQTIIATALPTIAINLGGLEFAAWAITAYLISAAISAPVFGRLGDALGRRRLLLVALAVNMFGAILCASASSMYLFFAARFIQGIGGGGMMTMAQALLNQSFAPRERARYQGYFATISVIASFFGPVAGGSITELLGWRWIFLVQLCIGGVAALLVFRSPQPPYAPKPLRMDWIGIALLALTVCTSLLWLELWRRDVNQGWIVKATVGSVALVGLVLLMTWERRVSDPLIPVGQLAKPSIWRSNALAFTHGAVLTALFTVVPLYLTMAGGHSPGQVGLLTLPMTLMVGVGATLTGRFIHRTGRSAIVPTIGLAMMAILFAGMGALIKELSTAQFVTSLGVIACLMGTVMTVVQVTVATESDVSQFGATAALVQLARSIGAAAGATTIWIIFFLSIASVQGAEFGGSGGAGLPVIVLMGVDFGMRNALFTLAAMAGLGCYFAATIPRRSI